MPSQAYSPCSKRGKHMLYRKVIHCDRRQEGNPWEGAANSISAWRAGASGRTERRRQDWTGPWSSSGYVIRLGEARRLGEETAGRKVLQPSGLRISSVTGAKAGVGRRWLEGAGAGAPGKAVKARLVRAVWIFAEWTQGHPVNGAPSHLYETGSPCLFHPNSITLMPIYFCLCIYHW